MKCEYCNKEHDGLYASGRFCSAECARGFSSKEKREEINEKVSNKLIKHGKGITEDSFISAVDNSKTMLEAAKKLDIPFTSFKRLAKTLKLYKPNQGWAKGLKFNRTPKEIFISEILIAKPKRKWSNTLIKAKLYEFNFKKEVCEECGQLPIWSGKKLVLQLNHINGINNDNRLENLQIICPNCHTQTSTFCSKNIKS